MATILRFPTERCRPKVTEVELSDARVLRLVERLERVFAAPEGSDQGRLAALLSRKLERVGCD